MAQWNRADPPSGAFSVHLQNLVETIVRALVDNPDAVAVTLFDGDTACALEIWAAPQDIGQVIGRQGRTIAAIRTLVHAAGAKERKHVIVEIVEERSMSWYRSPA